MLLNILMQRTCKYLENQTCIRTDGQYRLCCLSLEPDNKENINTHTPQEWHSSDFMKKTKQELAEGKWPDACIKCKTLEEAGMQSQRTKPRQYGPGLSHLDLRFGNSCNLKCISCFPNSSSSIAEEAADMQAAGIEPSWAPIPKNNVNWASEENFNKVLDLPLQEVYLTGGEPMMVKGIEKFLDKLDPSTNVRFNTNCTIWNPSLDKILRKFDTVVMAFSLDAVDRRIEYIRYGSNWITAEENAKRYAEYCYVSLTPTISVLNAHFVDTIREYCDKMKWPLFENYLYFPHWLDVRNAPETLKDKMTGVKKELLDSQADEKQFAIFKKQIQTLDKWRNINIRDYLPEVADAYGID